jgi:hypothetical protein
MPYSKRLVFNKYYKGRKNMTNQPDGCPIICKGNDSILLSKIGESAFDENTLQKHLAENPKILPIRELEPGWADACCVARELPTSAGPVDLLLVNAQGRLTIVETKLFKNPESRREVLAQSLDYAAAIHNMSYEELGNAVRRKNSKLAQETDPLLAMVKMNCPGEEINDEAFHDRVCTDLEVGQFLVLIVGEGIKKRLRTLVDYFDKISHLGFKVGLVSVEQWKTGEGTILLVPKVVGSIEREARVWTPDPNSSVAQEIAKTAIEVTKTSSGCRKPSLSNVEAIVSFQSEIGKLVDGEQIIKNLEELVRRCSVIGLTEKYSSSGSSFIMYHDEPKWEGDELFNLFQCSNKGKLNGTFFLQHKCNRNGLPDSIWQNHWANLSEITGVGTLIVKEKTTTENRHSFLDKNGKPPSMMDVLGANGEHVEAIAQLLGETANAIMVASEQLDD